MADKKNTVPAQEPAQSAQELAESTQSTAMLIPMDGIAPAVQERLGALKSPMLRNDLVRFAQLEAEGQSDRKRVLCKQAGIMAHIEDSKSYKAAGFKSRAHAMDETLGVKPAQASRDIKAWRVFGDAGKRTDVDEFLWKHTPSWDALRDLSDMTPVEREKLAYACGYTKEKPGDFAMSEDGKKRVITAADLPEEKSISWSTARSAKEAAIAARPPKERSGRAVTTRPYRVMTYTVDWNTAKVTGSPVTRQRLEVPKNSKGEFGATTIIDNKAYTIEVTPRGFTVTVAVPEPEEPKEKKPAAPKESPRAKAIAGLMALGYTAEEAAALADAKAGK